MATADWPIVYRVRADRGTISISDWLFLMIQKTGKWAMERSGFITSYESLKTAQSQAKTVTNLLILLSVLDGRSNFFV